MESSAWPPRRDERALQWSCRWLRVCVSGDSGDSGLGIGKRKSSAVCRSSIIQLLLRGNPLFWFLPMWLIFHSFALLQTNEWGNVATLFNQNRKTKPMFLPPLTQDCSFHPRLSLVGRFRLVAVLRWPRTESSGRWSGNQSWMTSLRWTLDPKKLTGSWLFEGDSQDVTFVLLFSTVWFTSLWWDQLDPKKFSPNPGNDRAARHWSESRGGSANRNFSHFFGGIPPIETLLFVDDHWSVIRCNEGKVEIDHWCNDAEMQSEKDFLSRRRN